MLRQGALGLWMLLGLAGCHASPKETAIPVTPLPPSDPALPPDAWNTARQVTAEYIYSRYSAGGRQSGDLEFQDHPLRLSAVFAGINRRQPGRTYMELQTQDKDAYVYAVLIPEAMPRLATLKPGTVVNMLCVGDGVVAGAPLLRACRFIPGS